MGGVGGLIEGEISHSYIFSPRENSRLLILDQMR